MASGFAVFSVPCCGVCLRDTVREAIVAGSGAEGDGKNRRQKYQELLSRGLQETRLYKGKGTSPKVSWSAVATRCHPVAFLS